MMEEPPISSAQSVCTRGTGSEANGVVSNFANMSDAQKQHVLNFLRSL